MYSGCVPYILDVCHINLYLYWVDIDECPLGVDPSPFCGNHTTCANSQGDYTCTCKAGWQPDPAHGNDTKCHDCIGRHYYVNKYYILN